MRIVGNHTVIAFVWALVGIGSVAARRRALGLLVFAAATLIAVPAKAAPDLLFVNTCCPGDFGFDTMTVVATSQDIPLSAGSNFAYNITHTISQQSAYFPGGSYFHGVYRGHFAIHAGVFGLPSDTAVISGTALIDITDDSFFGNDYSDISVGGTIDSVNPALLANLGFPPTLTGGNLSFQIFDCSAENPDECRSHAYAEVTLGPAISPEPGTLFLVGLAPVLLAGNRLRSRWRRHGFLSHAANLSDPRR